MKIVIGRFDVALKQLDKYESDKEEMLVRRPKCDCCGQHIQDDYLFNIVGDLYCEECLIDQFRHSTDGYIDD